MPAPVDAKTIRYDGLLSTNITGYEAISGPLHIPPQSKFICYDNHVTFLHNEPMYMGVMATFHCKVTYFSCTVLSDGSFHSPEAPPGT